MRELEIEYPKRNEEGRLLFCVNIRISLEREFFYDEIFQKDENGEISLELDSEMIFKNYRIDVFPMFYDVDYSEETAKEMQLLEKELDKISSHILEQDTQVLVLNHEEKTMLFDQLEAFSNALLNEKEFQHFLLPDFLLSFDKRNLNDDFIEHVKGKFSQNFFNDIYYICEQQNKMLEKSSLILVDSGDEDDKWLINWFNTVFFYLGDSYHADLFSEDALLNDPFLTSQQDVLKKLNDPELIDFVLDNPHLHYLGSDVLTEHFKLPFPVLILVEENKAKTKANVIGFIRLENNENE
jgi:hypothetical protein